MSKAAIEASENLSLHARMIERAMSMMDHMAKRRPHSDEDDMVLQMLAARQKATCLARRRGSHLGPFHDDDIDAAPTEEVGGAGADHAAAADHDSHGFSVDGPLNRRFWPWPSHIPRG